MRTFVAIKIILKRELEEALFHLRSEMKEENIKWADMNNLHVTLFFLGDTPELQINQISSGLKRVVEQYSQMSIILSGMGLFRNIRDPRIIWIGIEDNTDLRVLHSGIQELLNGLGYPKENRPFKPHLTIGRPKRITDKRKLMKEIEKQGKLCVQESLINEVIFYESILKEKGPKYRIIEKIFLKGVNQD